MKKVVLVVFAALMLSSAVAQADPQPPPPTPSVDGSMLYDQWPCGMSVGPGVNSALLRVRYRPC
jgi:hypothetical protein